MTLQADLADIDVMLADALETIDLIKQVQGDTEQTDYRRIKAKNEHNMDLLKSYIGKIREMLLGGVNQDYRLLLGDIEHGDVQLPSVDHFSNLNKDEVAFSSLVSKMTKIADLLDQSGFEDAVQAAEGLDAALTMSAEAGTDDGAALMLNIVSVAEYLDRSGKVDAAAYLDKIAFEYQVPEKYNRHNTREELYAHDDHNKSLLWSKVTQEISENRKIHHLETMRGKTTTLSTRYDPSLPGVQVVPVSDGVRQSILTGTIYDYNTGFTTDNGDVVSGGSVKNQTPSLSQIRNPTRMFDGKVDLDKKPPLMLKQK